LKVEAADHYHPGGRSANIVKQMYAGMNENKIHILSTKAEPTIQANKLLQ